MQTIFQRIADALSIKLAQVSAAVTLLDEGATVPFIARYRKEVTGSLDDTQLRQLEEKLVYLRELEERRSTVLTTIEEQGKLNDELKQAILAADTKTVLEDLYLPYKPKRRTKAQIAREAGLEPLADALLADPSLSPEDTAKDYIDSDQGVGDSKAALDGARYILMERFSEDADLIGQLRDRLEQEGVVISEVYAGKENEGAKFRDYFEYRERFNKVPSHRALALFRGRNEGILRVSLNLDLPGDFQGQHPCEYRIAQHWQIEDQGRPADTWLQSVVSWTWRVKMLAHIELDLMNQLREHAEGEAIRVFASNLKDLLLAAPAGAKATLGLDPGLRTGVKVAAVDTTGKVLDHCAIYPHAPQNQWDQAIETLATIARKHHIQLVSIGNGTASRETDKLVGDLIKRYPDLRLTKVMVSEAGASVYSASELAANEFPDLDVTIRGAVSIARRLQDPLAELVKIEPKAIGVGQYQHDLNQFKLARSLDAAVEDCVNNVGVDINTASAALLTRVAGLNTTTANNVVTFRDQHGAFKTRRDILGVPRLGEKAFEQAAGFLRINNGSDPLDASGVHPEAYQVVERIAEKHQRSLPDIMGDSVFLNALAANDYVCDDFGVPTITDIIKELDKPGRDPRPAFKTAALKEGVETLKDLCDNMILEGTITNVTNFGAFVDIGVHQDGLVHISAMSDRFISDPRSLVKAGDIVSVKVMEVDAQRKRIALSMRLDDQAGEAPAVAKEKRSNAPERQKTKKQSAPKPATTGNSVLADQLAAALKKR